MNRPIPNERRYTHPISFKASDIKQLMEGTKTQTRRLVRLDIHNQVRPCPFGYQGALLWVQESWGYDAELSQRDYSMGGERQHLRYRVDGAKVPLGGWRPVHEMPRWGSRVLLHVEETVCCELQSITAEDARAEGFTTVEEFAAAWNRNNRETIWSDNPRVWKLRFKAQVVR